MALQKLKFLDERGREIPDPTPVAIPAGFKKPESLIEQIRRLTRNELSKMADDQGMETFEESEDFDIDDDMFDPSSPYEEVFDPVLGRAITLDEFNKNEEVYRRRYLEAEQRAYQAMELSEALRARPKAKGGAGVSPAPSSEGNPPVVPQESKK